MRRDRTFWLQIGVAALCLAGAAAFWSERGAALAWLGVAPERAEPRRGGGGERAGPPVIAAPVEAARDDLTLDVVGTAKALRSVVLRVEAAGKIVETAVAAGARFEAGDVLLRLDDADARLALALAETRLAEAERARDRSQRLRVSGAAAEATVDGAETAAAIAAIELDRARRALEDRTLRAPFAGVAGLPGVEFGDRVEPGAAVASFDDRSRLLVEIDVPETVLSRVAIGARATATTPSAPGLAAAGVVAEIDSRIDVDSRTVRARVEIENPDDRLRPGASFAVRLELPGGVYPAVPELALQFSEGALHVWRLIDGIAERVEVTLVRRRGGLVLVEPIAPDTLTPGVRVVIEGAQRVRQGRPATDVSTAAGPGA